MNIYNIINLFIIKEYTREQNNLIILFLNNYFYISIEIN